MSELSKNNKTTFFQRNLIVIIMFVGLVVLLGFGYGGGYFLLPSTIKSAYQNKDCESVLSRNSIYTRLYPATIIDKGIINLVRECAIYTVAIRNEELKNWQDSYDAFRVYSNAYPQGLFITEIQGHCASVLMGLIKDEMSQKKYSEAVMNISILLQDYGDTAVVSEAEKLRTELYVALGTELRKTNDFAGAEQVFKELYALAQQDNDTKNSSMSQLELAQTNLEWGLELQMQEKFSEAKVKFDAAVSMDPDPSSGVGPAGQAIRNQVKLYTQWGDSLVQQGKFVKAMDYYGVAAELAENNDPNAANDIMTKAYIHWAVGMGEIEDFVGALTLLDFAETKSATESAKERVTDARQDIYLAFSRLTGNEGFKVLNDASAIVCIHQTKPRLPIYGLDTENVLVSVYGVEGELPKNIAATSPGSLHYVACVEEDTKIVGSAVNSIGSFYFDPNAPYSLVQIRYERHQYVWTISLRKIDTGEEVASAFIEGGEPPPLPSTTREIYEGAKNPLYFGSKPVIEDLVDWLLSVLR